MAEDIETLRARARLGEADAMCALGKALLGGANAGEGVALLERAAAAGDAEAHALLALLSAWGVLRKRDLGAAIAHLDAAARGGWAPAQSELAFLSHLFGADLGGAVAVGAHGRQPRPRALSISPRVSAIQGFASPTECARLIALGRDGLRRAQVYRKDAEGLAEADTRTNSEADYTIGRADVFLALLRERIGAALDIETRFFEVAKLLHYMPGQTFGLHADFIEPKTQALREDVRRHGQRVATFLIYLNDDYEGGETHFPEAGVHFKGLAGDALFFFNTTSDGALDYRSLHAGLPPTRGEKWLFSQWVRDKAFG